LLEVAAERLEPFLPEHAVVGDPVRGGPHRLRLEAAVVDATLLAARQQPGALEDAQVLRDGRQRDRERARQLRHGDVGRLGQPRQDRATRRIGEGAERGVQGGGPLRHG